MDRTPDSRGRNGNALPIIGQVIGVDMKIMSFWNILVLLWLILAAINVFYIANYDKAIVFAIFAVVMQLCAMEEKMK